MTPQKGQLSIIKKHIPDLGDKCVSIVAEAGNDTGETFSGSFIFKVGRKVYRADNGKVTKKIK